MAVLALIVRSAQLNPGQSLTEAVTYIRVIFHQQNYWETGPQDLQTHTREIRAVLSRPSYITPIFSKAH
jgi:hypothetical protein